MEITKSSQRALHLQYVLSLQPIKELIGLLLLFSHTPMAIVGLRMTSYVHIQILFYIQYSSSHC